MNKYSGSLKIIFLDIDGVLSGNDNLIKSFIFNKLIPRNLRDSDFIRDFYNPYIIDENKVKLLHDIVQKTNAKIVLCSAWRADALKFMLNRECIKKMHKNENARLLVEYFTKYNLHIYDITPKDPLAYRSTEIASWLDRCKKPIYSFVVIDDEINEEFMKYDKQVCTCDNPDRSGCWNICDGLRPKHVNHIINILNTKLDSKSKYVDNIIGGFY